MGVLLTCAAAQANALIGQKTIALYSRDGKVSPIGIVKMDPSKPKDFFLSMREFKCTEGPGEIQRSVPYPYTQPGIISVNDF